MTIGRYSAPACSKIVVCVGSIEGSGPIGIDLKALTDSVPVRDGVKAGFVVYSPSASHVSIRRGRIGRGREGCIVLTWVARSPVSASSAGTSKRRSK